MAKNEPLKYSTSSQRAATTRAETGKNSSEKAINSKNKMSSAKGPFQILDGTWRELEKSAGRSLDRKSVSDNDLAFELYTKKSEKALAQNGIEINPGNTYALHVFGQAGGVEYLKRMKSDPEGLATKGMSSAIINGNKPFFYDESGKPRTNIDSYKKISSRVGGPSDPGAITLAKNNAKQQLAYQGLLRQQQEQEVQAQEQQQEPVQEEVPEKVSEEQQPSKEQAPAEQSELSKVSNSFGLMFNGDSNNNFILPGQTPIVDGVKTSGEASMKAKTFADGGRVNDGLLNDFNVGGSHEDNPNGGIPQGMGQNGAQNTVEEGETRMGDYIFSDRLKLDKADVDNLYLPKEVIGMTYAEASKFINEFLEENPFDIIIKRTAESQLDSLKIGNDRAKSFKDQEDEIVAETDAPKYKFSGSSDSQGVQQEQLLSPEDQALAEQQESAQPKMAYGGYVNKYTHRGRNRFDEGTDLNGNEAEKGGGANIAGMAAGAAGLYAAGSDAFGYMNKKYDTSDLNANIDSPSGSGAAISNGLKMGAAGAQLGASTGIPGLGLAIGAVGAIGGIVSGIFGAKKQRRAAHTLAVNKNAGAFNNKFGETAPEVIPASPIMAAAYGGRINRFDEGTGLYPGQGTLSDREETFRIKNEYFFNKGLDSNGNSLFEINKDHKLTKEGFFAKNNKPQEFKLKTPSIVVPDNTITENGALKRSFDNKVSNQYYAGQADKRAAYDKEHPYRTPFVMKKDSPLKYAGAVGALGNFINSKKEKARVISSEGYTKTTTPNYFDESIIDNKMSQEMNNRSQAILATSGGSAAAARSMQYADSSEVNKLKSDSYSKMYEINNGVRDKDQAEIQRISDANVGIRNQDYQANLQEQDYVQGRKDKARDNLYASVEGIGQEQSDKNLLFNLSGGYKGGVYDPKDKLSFQNMVSNWSQGRRRNSNADGGIMSFVDNYENVQDKRRKYINEIKAQYNG